MSRFLCCSVVCVFLNVPIAAQADNTRGPQIIQAALNAKNALELMLLDETGNPLTQTVIRAQSRSETLQLPTDAQGRVITKALAPGLWIFTVDDQSVVCRIWTQSTAPPKASQRLTLVRPSAEIIRGNNSECKPCRPARMNRSNRKYGVTVLALGATAAYMALSRDNAS